jgi:hypothetical protein
MSTESHYSPRESFVVIVEREVGDFGLERFVLTVLDENGHNCPPHISPGSDIAAVVMETVRYLGLKESTGTLQ